jgi:hypothetical protein
LTEFDNKYKPEYADQLPKMFSNGEDVVEVCVEFDISTRTFYNWCNKYPEFKLAYERGKEYSKAWWLKLGRAGAAGKVNIQPSAWIFNMKNKFQWTDKSELAISGTTVTIKKRRFDGEK